MPQLDLSNHFLIPMPAMEDSIFSRSLTYICEHSERGALGIVVNRTTNLNLAELFEQIHVPTSQQELNKVPVYFGGPVQTDRGFVLHVPIGNWQSTLNITGNVGLTSSKDILEAVGEGLDPDNLLVTLGYAGWAEGQLEHELSQNAWLSVAASEHILFELSPEQRLPAAMALLGVDYANLSEVAGHA